MIRKMTLVTIMTTVALIASLSAAGVDTNMPASAVKIVFIHHSTGGNWLADANEDQPYGGLGRALMNNNYHVSATNYGWGPGSIGDRTDIPDWPGWFTGTGSGAILSALYTESAQNVGDFGAWSRLPVDPGGENTIVMFKSCFPNSNLFGNPNDPAATHPNDQFTVENAKAVYNDLLAYFTTRQDKLFVVITAPPQLESEYESDYQTPAQRAANTRAFNDWLVNDWLSGYTHHNVAVFDYFNVLTGENNHHRIAAGGQVEHVTADATNFAYYPSGDSHPSTTGHQKATTEFVPLLNHYYNQWVAGDSGGNEGGDTDPPNLDGGVTVASGLWLKAVLKTQSGDFTLRWSLVGTDTTPSGDRVVSGYFYADPADFAYGSPYNPEAFVKIYIAANGWANIAFNHVTVDELDIFSALSYTGNPDQSGTASLNDRLVEHTYTGAIID